MTGKRFLTSIQLDGFLSYKPDSPAIDLQSLNVIIGPNGSGKSNLLEAIEILRATPKDLEVAIRKSGGMTDLLWKGGEKIIAFGIDTVMAEIDPFGRNGYHGENSLFYSISLMSFDIRPIIRYERVKDNKGDLYNYRHRSSENKIISRTWSKESGAELPKRIDIVNDISSGILSSTQSIFSQIKDPRQYYEITSLGREFGAIKLYRDWNLGRHTPPRQPQPADMPNDFLEEDASNLGLVLNDLQNTPGAKKEIVRRLQQFNEHIEDIATRVHGGTVQIFLHEKGLSKPIPATRISDGTLHYLCLLSILCHPEPPPLICIEEPEIGLHPDVMPMLAELLIEASQRTQLIVTTHSDALVSALSNTPEAVLVCERDADGTHLRRLEAEPLKEWLDKYSLGELWRMGEIGGVP